MECHTSSIGACTKCEGNMFLAWPSLLFDDQSCLGFQLGLTEAQFEILGNSLSLFCSYFLGPKYKAQEKNMEAQYLFSKRKIKLHYYL